MTQYWAAALIGTFGTLSGLVGGWMVHAEMVTERVARIAGMVSILEQVCR